MLQKTNKTRGPHAGRMLLGLALMLLAAAAAGRGAEVKAPPAEAAGPAGTVVVDSLMDAAKKALQARKYEEARNLYGAVLKRVPDKLDALYGYAYGAEKMDDQKDAVAAYRAFITQVEELKKAGTSLEGRTECDAAELSRRLTRVRLLLLQIDKAGNEVRKLKEQQAKEWLALLKRVGSDLTEDDRRDVTAILAALGGAVPSEPAHQTEDVGEVKGGRLLALLRRCPVVGFSAKQKLWTDPAKVRFEGDASSGAVVVAHDDPGRPAVVLLLGGADGVKSVAMRARVEGHVDLILLDKNRENRTLYITLPAGRDAAVKAEVSGKGVSAQVDGSAATMQRFGDPAIGTWGLMIYEGASVRLTALAVGGS